MKKVKYSTNAPAVFSADENENRSQDLSINTAITRTLGCTQTRDPGTVSIAKSRAHYCDRLCVAISRAHKHRDPCDRLYETHQQAGLGRGKACGTVVSTGNNAAGSEIIVGLGLLGLFRIHRGLNNAPWNTTVILTACYEL